MKHMEIDRLAGMVAHEQLSMRELSKLISEVTEEVRYIYDKEFFPCERFENCLKNLLKMEERAEGLEFGISDILERLRKEYENA